MAILLDGKVTLITGAGSGIGRAASLIFAREGAKLMLSDIVAEGGEETLLMVKEAGAEAHFVRNDVSKLAEVEALVAKVISTWGRIDCAFNNAGIDGKMGKVTECTEENWNRTIAVNLSGVFFCMKAEIPHMLRQGGGRSSTPPRPPGSPARRDCRPMSRASTAWSASRARRRSNTGAKKSGSIAYARGRSARRCSGAC